MKKIDKYVSNRFKEITKNLESYHEVQDAERLHDIRVNIKKLKAIINLVGEKVEKFKSHREYKPLREIFRDAGEIRQPEVLLQLLLKYGIPKIEKDSALEKDFSSVDEFVDYAPLYLKTCKKVERRIKKYSDSIDHSFILKSIRKMEKRIKRSLSTKIEFDEIHKVRKTIKQLIYISDIYADLKKGDRVFYDELQEIIGAIHDKQALILLLRKTKEESLKKSLDDLHNAIESDTKMIISRCEKFYGVENIKVV